MLFAYSTFDALIPYESNSDQSHLLKSLLHHCDGDEVSTFWIFVSLMDNYDMRQVYQSGLPGKILNGEVLNNLIEMFLPHLNQVFKNYEVDS